MSAKTATQTLGLESRVQTAADPVAVDGEPPVSSRPFPVEVDGIEFDALKHAISQGLRAPARWIDGFARAIEEDAGAVLDASAKQHLVQVRTAARAMGQFIDDYLSFVQVGHDALRREALDFSMVARAVVDRVRQRCPGRQVAVLVADGLQATADEHLLRVALDALLTNAFKFTGRTADARVEIGSALLGGETAYYVKDNGVGFDPALSEKLFVPFQRLHGSTEFPGNGIGLATMKRIVSRHGGRVWSESSPGAGAMFWFTLPPA